MRRSLASALRFYRTWFTTAFFHPLGLAALVFWVLGAIGYVARRWFLVPEAVLADIAWQLSLGLVVVLSVARLVAVPYWIVRDERAARSEVEEERDSLLRQLERREERQAVLDRLGARFGEADILFRRKVESDAAFERWGSQLFAWKDQVEHEIRSGWSEAEVRLFGMVAGGATYNFKHAYNQEHQGLLNNLQKWKANLGSIIEHESQSLRSGRGAG